MCCTHNDLHAKAPGTSRHTGASTYLVRLMVRLVRRVTNMTILLRVAPILVSGAVRRALRPPHDGAPRARRRFKATVVSRHPGRRTNAPRAVHARTTSARFISISLGESALLLGKSAALLGRSEALLSTSTALLGKSGVLLGKRAGLWGKREAQLSKNAALLRQSTTHLERGLSAKTIRLTLFSSSV